MSDTVARMGVYDLLETLAVTFDGPEKTREYLRGELRSLIHILYFYHMDKADIRCDVEAVIQEMEAVVNASK